MKKIIISLSFLTLGIVLFSQNSFEIEYETRPNSNDFLKNLDEYKKDENIDFYNMYNNFLTIKEWFKTKIKNSSFTNS